MHIHIHIHIHFYAFMCCAFVEDLASEVNVLGMGPTNALPMACSERIYFKHLSFWCAPLLCLKGEGGAPGPPRGPSHPPPGRLDVVKHPDLKHCFTLGCIKGSNNDPLHLSKWSSHLHGSSCFTFYAAFKKLQKRFPNEFCLDPVGASTILFVIPAD